MKKSKIFTVTSNSADTYDPQNLIQCSYIQKDGQLLKTTALVDTGAHRSVVSLKTLGKIKFEMGQRRRRKYVGATNHEMEAGKYYANFKIIINGQKYPIENALVRDSNESNNELIIGQSDLRNLKAILHEENGIMHIGRSNRTVVQRYNHQEIKKFKINASINTITSNKNENELSSSSTQATIGDTCYMGGQVRIENDEMPEPSQICQGCPKCTTNDNAIQKEHYHKIDDSKAALKIMCHKIRSKMHNTFSHEKVTICPIGEKRYPFAAKEVRRLNEKYKENFAASIGDVGNEFVCNCEIKGQQTKRMAGQQQFIGDEKAAVKKQLIELIANGVIRPIDELNIIPKYFVSIMPRIKKDDDGVKYDPMACLRIVNDFSKVNEMVDYAGCPCDNISECVDWAAKSSVNGLNLKTDISSCYFCIRIHEDLFPYLCISVPDLGEFAFVRLPQGWSYSAQYTVFVLKRIFWKFGDKMQRYLDDIFLSLNNSNATEKDFVELYESFMRTLKRYNLRIKGSKTFVLLASFNFLGYRINEGTIGPNPHLVNRILDINWQDLKTVKQVMALIGMARYLARFMKRSTHVMNGLTKAIKNKKTAEKVNWDEQLIEAFEKVKEAMKELTKTYPLESDLQTVIAVDTSAIATGGIVYQIDKDGKPRISAFFSRSRKDKERKYKISSCHMELYGLVVLLESFRPWLMQMLHPITVITDSHSLVKLYKKFKLNMCPSNDMKLNNSLWELRHYNLNIMHASNKSAIMLSPDFISRIGYEPKSIEKGLCQDVEGVAKCAICELAELPLENAKNFNEKIGKLCKIMAADAYMDKNHIFQIRPELQIVPIGQLKKKNITLTELLNNCAIIRDLQKMDKVYRSIIDAMENGRPHFPRKFPKAETIRLNRKPELKNGALTLHKYLDGVEIRVFPVPKEAGWVVIHAVHLDVGHRAPTQMVKQVAKYFEFENMKKMTELYIGKCIPCTLLRSEAKYHKVKQKPVKMTDKPFKQILVDEVHRTRKDKNYKIMVAMEAISQFMIALPMDQKPCSNDFISKIVLIRTMMAPHVMENPEIEIRCDEAPWHTSNKVKETLNMLNIKVELHRSSTLSKNQLPELDAKIKQLSRWIEHYSTTTKLETDWCVALAVQKCNTTVGKMNYTPAEIFTGYNPTAMTDFKLNISEYIEEIKRIRKMKRESAERKIFKEKVLKNKDTVPYKNPKLNDPLQMSSVNFTKLKSGDLVKLNTDFDKNAKGMNLYTILGINFKEKVVQLVRAGDNASKPIKRYVAFERICRHIPMNKEGTVGLIQMLRQDEWNAIEYIDEKDPADADNLKYIIPRVEQRELEDIQCQLNILIKRIIPAMNNIEDTMYDGEITAESSIGQKVPEKPTIILDEEKEETIDKIINEETKNEEAKDVSINPGYYDPDTIEDYEESDSNLTVNCRQMNNVSNNSSVQTLSDESYVDVDESYNMRMERSYMHDWTILNDEEAAEGMNSTQSEAVVPELEFDAKPIRNRRKPDYYQAS